MLELIRGGFADRTAKVESQRTRIAQQTLRDLQPFLKAAGITRIADVTGLDRLGIPVALAVRPNSRSLSVSQGKGLDLVRAKVSAILEALESFHAERLDWPLHLLRWTEISGTSRAVRINRLPLAKDSPFHEDMRIAWTAALDMATGQERLVPAELVHADFTLPAPLGSGCFPVTSNGLASGNTFAEALVHGLCELIERDAFALYSRRPGGAARQVSLAASGEPSLVWLMERIAKAECRVVLEDITSEIGVPVFFATISQGGDSPVTAAPAGGLGCHPDPVVAMVRAITEAAQSRLTRISGSRDDLTARWFRPPLPEPPRPENTHVAELPFQTVPGLRAETVEEDLVWIVRRLTESGFDEILVADLSRREFGLPVVRMIVPGLEYAPGQNAVPGKRADRAA